MTSDARHRAARAQWRHEWKRLTELLDGHGRPDELIELLPYTSMPEAVDAIRVLEYLIEKGWRSQK